MIILKKLLAVGLCVFGVQLNVFAYNSVALEKEVLIIRDFAKRMSDFDCSKENEDISNWLLEKLNGADYVSDYFIKNLACLLISDTATLYEKVQTLSIMRKNDLYKKACEKEKSWQGTKSFLFGFGFFSLLGMCIIDSIFNSANKNKSIVDDLVKQVVDKLPDRLEAKKIIPFASDNFHGWIIGGK